MNLAPAENVTAPVPGPVLPPVDEAGERLLAEAGVKVGDDVFWQPAPTMIGRGDERRVRVHGIHYGEHDTNRGVPAIEVRDTAGHGYRAYPGELRPA